MKRKQPGNIVKCVWEKHKDSLKAAIYIDQNQIQNKQNERVLQSHRNEQYKDECTAVLGVVYALCILHNYVMVYSIGEKNNILTECYKKCDVQIEQYNFEQFNKILKKNPL